MTDLVERAKAALEGVTEGPWAFTCGVVWRVDVVAVPDPDDPSGQTPMPEAVQEKVCDTSPAEAEFIAAARTLVPELVAEVEQLEQDVVAARLTCWEATFLRSAEDLDAVPVGGIVRSGMGTIACRYDATRGVCFGDERTFPWTDLALPCQLIWDPRQVDHG